MWNGAKAWAEGSGIPLQQPHRCAKEQRPGLRNLASGCHSRIGMPDSSVSPLQKQDPPLQVVNFVHVDGVPLVGHYVKEEPLPAGATRHAPIGSWTAGVAGVSDQPLDCLHLSLRQEAFINVCLQAKMYICLTASVTAFISASHNQSADFTPAVQKVYALLHLCERHGEYAKISELASTGLRQGG